MWCSRSPARAWSWSCIALGGRASADGEIRDPNDLASDIDGLVIGTARTAPGATAYVLGPGGAWLGAAGTADVKTGETIRPDARMRLESVSKMFTAT